MINYHSHSMQNPPESSQTQLPEWVLKNFPKITDIWIHTPNWFHQAVRFGMVGVLNTGVDLGSYWILTRFIPYFENAHVLAKAISYTLGVLNSYLWNRSFTFRSQVRSPKQFAIFFLINLIAVGINSGLMALSLHVFELPEWVGLLIATAITMTWNFTTSKFIVFREPSNKV